MGLRLFLIQILILFIKRTHMESFDFKDDGGGIQQDIEDFAEEVSRFDDLWLGVPQGFRLDEHEYPSHFTDLYSDAGNRIEFPGGSRFLP